MWIILTISLFLNRHLIIANPILKANSRPEENLPARPMVEWANPHFKPYFDSSNQQNITAQLGKSTFLICNIRNIHDESVSWIRQKDLNILSAGEFVFISDTRFRATHVENSEKWALHIDDVQKEDEGEYICQISSEPKISLPFYLKVIEANTEIIGKTILNHRRGDLLNLTCIVNQSAAPPRFIYWEHENRVLNFLESSPNKFKIIDNLDQLRLLSEDQLNNQLNSNHFHVHTHNSNQQHQTTNYQSINQQIIDQNQPFISHLLIYDFDHSDIGNYTCRSIPQYSEAANITVHMLNEENQLFFSNHYYSNNERNMFYINWLSLIILEFLIINLINNLII